MSEHWLPWLNHIVLNKPKFKTGVASGYFNPLGSHHITYLRACKECCENLVVIVNNDKQVQLKGSCPFQNELERLEIVGSLAIVYTACISIDDDESVAKTLAYLDKTFDVDVFFNGGDQIKANQKEAEICRDYNIEMMFGVGGEKLGSSSKLIYDAYNWIINKRINETSNEEITDYCAWVRSQ